MGSIKGPVGTLVAIRDAHVKDTGKGCLLLLNMCRSKIEGVHVKLIDWVEFNIVSMLAAI